ncbi:hypothetical protein ACCO45_009696 [Purpureocillium lilacinum]|uniref:Uncharacterized protein n=1 Tax=Purpureocillium lilacinum TaxID=33203 RepID=A0ACC4DKF6_PURLI
MCVPRSDGGTKIATKEVNVVAKEQSDLLLKTPCRRSSADRIGVASLAAAASKAPRGEYPDSSNPRRLRHGRENNQHAAAGSGIHHYGGCNCGSVRYRIAVPSLADRPPAFTLGADTDRPGAPRVPHVVSCHCSDCRAASGQPSMAAIVAAAHMVTVSALSLSAEDAAAQAITGRVVDKPTSEGEVAAADASPARPAYVPAVDVLRPGAPRSHGTTLRFFHAYMCDGEVASRSFCVRCGGPVAFHYRPKAEWLGATWFRPPHGWDDVVDVLLGTVDAHVLDRDDWLAVEHELFWKEALGWVKRERVSGTRGSRGIPREPWARLKRRWTGRKQA